MLLTVDFLTLTRLFVRIFEKQVGDHLLDYFFFFLGRLHLCAFKLNSVK